MQYHRWGIRLQDSNRIKQYALKLAAIPLSFSGLGQWTRTWDTQESARSALRADKLLYWVKWKMRQYHGITATVVKMNIEIRDVGGMT